MFQGGNPAEKFVDDRPESGHTPSPRGPAVPIGVAELRRRVLTLGFGVVTLSVVALLLVIYGQLARPILWAGTLAVLVYPLHQLVLRQVRGRAGLAAVISTVFSLAVIFIPAAIAVSQLLREVQNLWPSIRDSLGPEAFEKAALWLEESRLKGLAHLLFGGGGGSGAEALESHLREAAVGLQDLLSGRLRAVTRSVPVALIQLGVTLLTYFFFLKNGPRWLVQIKGALPLQADHANRLLGILGQTINAVFRGVIVTAAVQALLAGLGYWVVGVRTPVLLSTITFIAALIPFVGPVAVWLPVSVGLLLAGRTGAAIGLAAWGTLVVSLIDNALRPYLIGRDTKLPMLWLFLSILGALRLFGFLGVVVGPAALALALACYRLYREGLGGSDEPAG